MFLVHGHVADFTTHLFSAGVPEYVEVVIDDEMLAIGAGAREILQQLGLLLRDFGGDFGEATLGYF